MDTRDITHPVPQHEKIFNEICSKLNELSQVHEEEQVEENLQHEISNQQKFEKLQTQIKRFQGDINETQSELREKIKTLENVHHTQSDLNSQLKQLTELLHQERTINSKLNADLSKSLEMNLQMQLEVQSYKSKSMQALNEEKRYSLGLQEKMKIAMKEVEAQRHLREESMAEADRQRKISQNDVSIARQKILDLELAAESMGKEHEKLLQTNQEMLIAVKDKEALVKELQQQIESLSQSIGELEHSSAQQGNVIKSLMEVAESKIVEMKLSLDKKALEVQDYYSHLQQALAQANVLKQENLNLKDYIAKLNYFIQQNQQQIAAQPS